MQGLMEVGINVCLYVIDYLWADIRETVVVTSSERGTERLKGRGQRSSSSWKG